MTKSKVTTYFSSANISVLAHSLALKIIKRNRNAFNFNKAALIYYYALD